MRKKVVTIDEQENETTTNVLYWIFSDHLQSSSVILEKDGTLYSRTSYTAFGEVRYESAPSPTDYQYTGQRSYLDGFGLHYYVARWYDPVTAHFTQADTIIPSPGNSGDWDRYAYVLNNPMRYTDPTGHWIEIEGDDDLTNKTNREAKRKTHGNSKANPLRSSKAEPPKKKNTQYDLGTRYGVGANGNTTGSGTCSLANAAFATGANPDDVYSYFANNQGSLPALWWDANELAEFINNTDELFPSASAQSGTLTSFYSNSNPEDIVGNFDYLQYLVENDYAVIALISASTQGDPITDQAKRKELNNHWVTILNVSTADNGGHIVTYWDSMTDRNVSVPENDFRDAWFNLPTNSIMIIVNTR